MRNIYRSYTGKTNVKKEIKKRLRRVLGNDPDGNGDGGPVDRERFLRDQENDSSPNPNFGQNNDGDDHSS